ncbi:hypothetical protein L227DRAFT_163474 [Lentinus tigrinus ALCF2SS1-6]|uniref:Uncharacterized protein n=1 Tax=Lentinus tigrinus ALCF2SS1-6 TaxID=1328759 RepID=A0A5C2S620_9APHY|nr:hypothetical protein L227DRAFT_163474 [Lentinus tigrinus ALCF2SS1-6]
MGAIAFLYLQRYGPTSRSPVFLILHVDPSSESPSLLPLQPYCPSDITSEIPRSAGSIRAWTSGFRQSALRPGGSERTPSVGVACLETTSTTPSDNAASPSPAPHTSWTAAPHSCRAVHIAPKVASAEADPRNSHTIGVKQGGDIGEKVVMTGYVAPALHNGGRPLSRERPPATARCT